MEFFFIYTHTHSSRAQGSEADADVQLPQSATKKKTKQTHGRNSWNSCSRPIGTSSHILEMIRWVPVRQLRPNVAVECLVLLQSFGQVLTTCLDTDSVFASRIYLKFGHHVTFPCSSSELIRLLLPENTAGLVEHYEILSQMLQQADLVKTILFVRRRLWICPPDVSATQRTQWRTTAQIWHNTSSVLRSSLRNLLSAY
jgi:hypothetical protein